MTKERTVSVDDQGAAKSEEALASILAWSRERPEWQRDALRRLCVHGSISEGDLVELADICRNKGQGFRPLEAEHIPDPRSATSTVRLRRIKDVQNVNALKVGERLSFNTNGLTVIYGGNGSGKSGYARILKKVCRSRSQSEDAILPNIYAKEAGPATATIDYSVDGRNTSQEWSADDEHATPLGSVSVFDATTAGVHVDATNDVAYKPFPMRLLEDLADVCRNLGQRLRKEIQALERERPSTIANPSCHSGTKVHELISSLDADTEESIVRSLARLTPQEITRLTELESDLAGDSSAVVAQLELARERLERGDKKLVRLENAVAADRISDLCQLYQGYAIARGAATAAAEMSFGSEPLPDVGTDVWRLLWKAARKFSEEHVYRDRQFPVTDTGSRCVLCHQVLGEEASDRLKRFDVFVKDEVRRLELQKKSEYESALSELHDADLNINEISEILKHVRSFYGEGRHVRSIRRSAIMLIWRLRAAIRLHKANLGGDWLPPADSYRAKIIGSATAEITRRTGSIQADEGSQERMQALRQYQELKDRKWLEAIVEDVVAEVNRRKEVSILQYLLAATSTQAITNKSREISGLLVTDALRAQFAREIDKLGVAGLAVEIHRSQATYGVPKFKVSLIRKPDQRVGAVLSEGEHRCIALCAFLAELVTTDGNAGIVFDDPVSSLDHSYREAVARRLAELARERQVVVFTHDIVFLFQLDEWCREIEAQVGYRSITRGDEFAGICEADPPVRAQPLERVLSGMETMVKNVRFLYDSGKTSAWEDKVDALALRIRSAWERAVEETISPVLRRLSDKVETRGLVKVTALEVEDCIEMREAYGRCSRWLHSSADALNTRAPSPDEVLVEIRVLGDWIRDIRLRQGKMAADS